MAILTSEQKKQRNLIGVMGFFVILSVSVLYFGFLRKDELNVSSIGTVQGSGREIFSNVRAIQLDVDLLEDKRLKDLIPYDKISAQIKTGRKNPFEPY